MLPGHWLKFQKRATNIILETRKIVICNKSIKRSLHRKQVNVAQLHSEVLKCHIAFISGS